MKPKAVQSIKDLKREIEKIREAYKWDCSVAIDSISVEINEFEAGLKERLKICDDLVEQLKRDGEKWEYHPARVESLALRAVLGLGEGES